MKVDMTNDYSIVYNGMYVCKVKTKEDLFFMVCENFEGHWVPQSTIFSEHVEVIEWSRLPEPTTPAQ